MLLLALGCYSPDPIVTPAGALGEGSLNPFPSTELVADGHLAFRAGELPNRGVDWDVDRLDERTGFSVVQPSVVQLPAPVDPDSIAGQAGLGTGGSVRMFDLDSGAELPVLAELDANEDAAESGNPALIVRPMEAMTPGHTVAVVLTNEVTTNGLPFDNLPEPAGHYADLRDELSAMGVDDVQLAWDFPVGDGTAPLRSVLEQVGTPSSWTFTTTWLPGSELEPLVDATMQLEGTFVADDFLVDDVALDYADGTAAPQGSTDAYLFVHVPPSVATAADGSVPVMIFGHGIFGNPREYFADPDNLHQLEIADRLGVVVVATVWRGLTTDDQLHAFDVAGDFPRIHEITDMLVQGVANTVQLQRLVQTDTFWADPAFDTIRSKVDPTKVLYFGISLGGIEGAVTLANDVEFDAGVFHVGGSDWSTMLERSVDWPPFQAVVQRDYEDPVERQLLYATSQLYWDAVDPADYVDALRGGTFLWQESIGDDQVPNITTELLMRSIGVTLGTPAVTSPPNIGQQALPMDAPAFTQFDAEVGDATTTNVPGTLTNAHTIPRTWEGMKAQVVTFLAEGGVVEHFCGDGPCTAENTGD